MRAAAQRLATHGIETAALDAKLLVQHALSLTAEDMVRDAMRPLTPEEITACDVLIARRAQHEPVSHILGQRAFWKDMFIVTPDVLTPRPDSETMLEALCAHRPEKSAPYRLLDLGTGSGCLLLSALREYPNAHGTGLDISPAALAVAQRNAEALALAPRVQFLQSDWLAQLDRDTRFDMVLMNPPYIPTRDIATLAPDVRNHEPMLALDGGADGLDCYRKIFSQFPLYLSPHALILIEVGVHQAQDVAELGRTNGMKLIEIRRDLAQIDRIVILELP
jgi:release factor glutamine methyltransferase